MKWTKGLCSYCSAGEGGPKVEVTRIEHLAGSGYEDGTMCRVCFDLGLSRYSHQNHRPATPVDISRAVRIILKVIRGAEQP